MKKLSIKLKSFMLIILAFTILLSGTYATTFTLDENSNIYFGKDTPQVIQKATKGQSFQLISEDDSYYQVTLDNKTNGYIKKAIYSNPNAKGVFNYPLSGAVVESYSDETIKVSIEKIGNYYVSKVWVLNPSLQVNKVEAGWGTNLETVNTMLNATPGAIVGCNGSGFYKSGSWHPAEDEIRATAWNKTTEGFLVISNGVVRRAINGKKCNRLLAIMPDGSLEYCNNVAYSELINAGVKNTFAFGPLLVKKGKNQGSADTRSASRTAVGQMDENNYVIINSSGQLGALASFGTSLGCEILYNLDGGGSRTLWFRGAPSGSGIQVRSSTREVADALYFSSLK